MEFKKEKFITPIIQKNIKNVFDLENKSLAITKEFPVSNRKIDLIFLVINNNDIFKKHDEYLIKSLKKLSLKELYVFSIICKHKTISIQKLSNKLFLDYYKTKKDYIKVLEKNDLIKRISKFKYKLTNDIDDKIGLIYSLEIKLNDWKTALEQAKDTQEFSDYSYVAMDFSFIKQNIDIIEEYKNKNIGLMGVTKDGNINFFVKPQKENKKNINSYRYQQIKAYREIASNNSRWEILN